MESTTQAFLVVLLTSVWIGCSGHWCASLRFPLTLTRTFNRLLTLQSSLQSGTMSSRRFCSNARWMTEHQLQKCEANPAAMIMIGKGTLKGIKECQYQFQFRRWNCTGIGRHGSMWRFFEKMNKNKTKETAFLSAIASAGAAVELSQACAKGVIASCGCQEVRYGGTLQEASAIYQWRGCSEDVHYGIRYSREFLDPNSDSYSYTRRRSLKKLVTLQNNIVGRELLEQNKQKVCKCQGATGSCATKICWETLPHLRGIGAKLIDKYENAILVRPNRRRTKLKSQLNRRYKIKRTDLVYIHQSPDFCEPNKPIGLLGTHGRVCNRTSNGMDGCRILCCGRGYDTLIIRKTIRCHCKFHWCCYVKCKYCQTEYYEYRCK